MYERLYSLVGKVCLQLVSMLTTYRENMIDVGGSIIYFRQADERIADVFSIIVGYCSSQLNIFIKVSKFYAQQCSLYFV